VGLGFQPHELDLTIYNLLMERDLAYSDVVLKTNVDGMDLLPANIDLSVAELQLVQEVGREHALSRALAPAIPAYDVILIDCQPSLGLLTVNALTAADGVIVPMECEYFALRGVASLTITIDKVRERLNSRLRVVGLLGTMYDGRTLHSRQVLQRLVEGWGDTVFHTVIRRTVKFSESTTTGSPITSVRLGLPGRHRLPPACPRGARSVPDAVDLSPAAPSQPLEPPSVAGSVGGFAVHLANFEGPFDLLLRLIAKHQLDITEIALSKVTDEFLGYVKEAGADGDLDHTSSFLVVAATLLDLKAARLLPRGDVEDEADVALLEARDLLFARLLQYRAYKQVAAWFDEHLTAEARRWPRTPQLDERLTAASPQGADRLGCRGVRRRRRAGAGAAA
jgi:cellulose biosynthesis protein BcsQ